MYSSDPSLLICGGSPVENGQQSVSQQAKDYGTRGTDAQVTTLPGEEAITPSETEALFSICCEAHSAKPVISRFKNICSLALGKLCFLWHSSIHSCLCAHNQAPLSHQSNEASVSWGVTSLFHTSGCSLARHICFPTVLLIRIICH